MGLFHGFGGRERTTAIDPFGSARRRRLVVLLSVAILIQALAWAFLTYFFTGRTRWYGFFDVSDVGLYHDFADQLARGLVPYKDFAFEYPPLAIPLMSLPRRFTSVASYDWCFAAEMILLCAMTALVVTATAARVWRGWRSPFVAALAFGLVTVLAGPIVANRFDIAVAFVMSTFVYCLVRRWWGLAGLMLGIGFALKLTPLIFLPLVVLFARRRTQIACVLLVFVVAAAMPFVPHLLRAGADVAYLFSYHGKRPLQIESLLSTPYLLGHGLGLGKVVVATSYGSQGITAPGSRVLAALSPWFMTGGLAFLYAVLWHRRRKIRGVRSDLPMLALALVLVCVCTSKVLSPQFLVWTFPFVALVAARTGLAHKAVGGLLAVTILLTQVEFPTLYWSLVALESGPVAVVSARNGVLLGATALVLGYVVRVVGADRRT
jgi:hypothetical protein